MYIDIILKNIAFAFQPIVNTQSGNTIAVEALLTGIENLNFNNIFAFLKEADKEEILYKLELGLFKKALESYKKIAFYQNILLFFNITNEFAINVDFNINDILNILKVVNVSIDNICFDIDSSNRLGNFNKTLKKSVNLARKVGFKISVDNFSIESSNLALLNSVQPSFIKVDKTLIESLKSNSKYNTYMEYFIKTAHLFGINIIAECVEKEEEYLTVKEMGFEMLQGFFVCKPTTNTDEIKSNYAHIQKLATSEKIISNNDTSLINMYKKVLEPIHIDTPMEEVLQRFKNNPDEILFPVIDNSEHPIGLICEKELKVYIYSSYGKDLLLNKALNITLRKFLTYAPTVDIKSSIEDIIKTYGQHKNINGIIITNDFKYSGFLYPKDIINMINLKEIEMAKEINPLTRLPGTIQIDTYISTCLKDEQSYKYFIYCDFNHFKPFNDTYGFKVGDRIIFMFRDLLLKTFNTKDFFIGHFGGDNFFVGLSNKNEFLKEIYNKTQYLVLKFNENILIFFDEESRKTGFYVGMNKNWEREIFPCPSLNAIIIEIPPKIKNINEETINIMLKKLRKKAKNPSNIFTVSVNK